jgi:hypothetical protein
MEQRTLKFSLDHQQLSMLQSLELVSSKYNENPSSKNKPKFIERKRDRVPLEALGSLQDLHLPLPPPSGLDSPLRVAVAPQGDPTQYNHYQEKILNNDQYCQKTEEHGKTT